MKKKEPKLLIPFNVYAKPPIYIALDDGHGMETAGKRTPNFKDGTKSKETGKDFMHENEFNRRVVAILKEELERCGFRVLLVAPTDADTPLADRVKLANKEKVDFYFSVHANAMKGVWGTARGLETFTAHKGEGLRIGKILHKHMMQGTEFADRGMKDGNHLYVIRATNMPSALVECGFMDNDREARLLLSEEYRQECAIEFAKGFCEAYGIQYKPKKGVLGVSQELTSKQQDLLKEAKRLGITDGKDPLASVNRMYLFSALVGQGQKIEKLEKTVAELQKKIK